MAVGDAKSIKKEARLTKPTTINKTRQSERGRKGGQEGGDGIAVRCPVGGVVFLSLF